MKKNIIFLVIDSLFYNKLGFAREGCSPTPFLDDLVKKSFYATNMYSQAPFTEAALMALLASCDTMDNGGYLMRFKDSKKTIGEVFKDNGYRTFHQYQPHIHPTSLKRGFSSIYYSTVFDFNALWEYRLAYYSDLLKNNELIKEDWDNIVDLIRDNLQGWIEFLESLVENSEAISLIKDNIRSYDASESLDIVKEEFNKFSNNAEKYSEELLVQGKLHKLFSISVPQQEKIKSAEFKQRVIEEYKEFFEKSLNANKKYNIKNNKLSLNQFGSILRETNSNNPEGKSKTIVRYLYNYYRAIKDPDFMDRIDINYDGFKSGPSFQSHLDHFKKWALNEKERSVPFFSYIHLDDIHSPEMFFNYDATDLEILKEDFQALEKFLYKLPPTYKGSLAYDYALVYIDLCIKRMFSWLKASGLYETTNIVITADHGFSFAYDPVRKSVVNNFYDENYKIPFIICGSDIKPQKISGFTSSIDIAPTVLEMAGIECPGSFKGVSLFKAPDGRDFVRMEYMGGGCPDTSRRPVLHCIRNNKIKIVYSASINEEFSKGRILEIYDIEKDPLNYNNAYKRLGNHPETLKLLNHIKLRHEELQTQYKR